MLLKGNELMLWLVKTYRREKKLLKRRFIYIYIYIYESPIPKIGCWGNGFVDETNIMSLKYVKKKT